MAASAGSPPRTVPVVTLPTWTISPGTRTAHIGDLDRPDGHIQVLGEVIDFAGVADLAAGLHVEDRLGQHNFNLVASIGTFDRPAPDKQGRHLGLNLGQVLVDPIAHAVAVDDTLVLELLQHLGVDRDILPNLLDRRGTAALFRLGQRGAEAGLVYGQPIVLGDIARQVDREAIGIPQVEGFLAADDRAAFGAPCVPSARPGCAARW